MMKVGLLILSIVKTERPCAGEDVESKGELIVNMRPTGPFIGPIVDAT